MYVCVCVRVCVMCLMSCACECVCCKPFNPSLHPYHRNVHPKPQVSLLPPCKAAATNSLWILLGYININQCFQKDESPKHSSHLHTTHATHTHTHTNVHTLTHTPHTHATTYTLKRSWTYTLAQKHTCMQVHPIVDIHTCHTHTHQTEGAAFASHTMLFTG